MTLQCTVQNQPWPTHPKNDAYGTTNSLLYEMHQNDWHIAVRAGLDL